MIRTFFILVILICHSLYIQSQSKSICITIDDLPVVSATRTPQRLTYITKNLLNILQEHNVPAIGFVNEAKIRVDGKVSGPLSDLLVQWRTFHFELGNHTYSHIDVNTANSMQTVEKNLIKGESFIDKLMASDLKRVKYFRHPYLHKGNTIDKKNAYELLLKKHNYIEAPVTVDNEDYIFAQGYDKAYSKKDVAMSKKIGEAYVPYMMSKVMYYESQADTLFHRDISQILLIHANSINAEYLGGLLTALENRGYKFVSLTESLKDPAYTTKDSFVGDAGISWIHRWMISQGNKKSFGTEPEIPAFISIYANGKK